MAHKGEDERPDAESGATLDLNSETTDIENFVTSEAGELVAHGFDDESVAAATREISILDAALSPHVAPKEDGPFEPGFILNNRFEIVELIHTGGMGHVYKAVDYRRDRIGAVDAYVAIKILRGDISLSRDADFVLEREAAKAQSLSHPNVINIFDFDDHEGHFYLVMEWLEGESVSAMIQRRSDQRLEPDEAWPIIESAAAAVEHAHQHNVIHADINPANIFVTRDGEIKLLDFGIARNCDDAAGSADSRFAWVTQTYASPEMLAGQPPVYEDDIFSLGCVAYRLLSGTHPFGGSASSVAKQLGVEVKRIPDLPEADWQILRRALAYTREERSMPVSIFIRGRTAGPPTGGHDRSQKWPLRPWPLAASLVAIAVVAAGWWFLQQATRDDPATSTLQESVTGVVPPESGAPAQESPVEVLLANAALAVEEQRLVTPDDNNARGLYLQSLAIDPGNPAALRGLRTISDVYVQQANDAIQASDPIRASAALEIASATDPANPAIAIANELLIAQGDRQLAAASLAVGEGDLAEANELLSVAEKYGHIEESALDEVRLQISQAGQEAQFLDALATAEAHISAGRLTAPVDENAQTVLTTLLEQHRDDARLLASMERLGERLLTRAAFAAAGGQYARAGELLDDVEALGVLSDDVMAARAALRDTVGDTDRGQQMAVVTDDARLTPMTTVGDSGAETPPAAGGIASGAASGEPEAADAPAGEPIPGETVTGEAMSDKSMADDFIASESGPALSTAGESESGEIALLPVSGDRNQVASVPQTAASAALTGNEVEEPRFRKLEELGLRKYVPPRYPRRASRRGISGFVEIAFEVDTDGRTGAIEILNAEPGEIFDSSAEVAVRQWRFAPQDRVVKASVVVRFDAAR